MMQGDTIMREGLRQALMEAMANLYRVYTSPNHAEEYEEAFKRGAEQHAATFERMSELITQRKLV